MAPLKAIRLKCLDCVCGNAKEVKLCACTGCALYQYREGHNPARKGKGGMFTLPETQTQKIIGSINDFEVQNENVL